MKKIIRAGLLGVLLAGIVQGTSASTENKTLIEQYREIEKSRLFDFLKDYQSVAPERANVMKSVMDARQLETISERLMLISRQLQMLVDLEIARSEFLLKKSREKA